MIALYNNETLLHESNNVQDQGQMITFLLDKVSTKLKEPVKMLASYIVENGKGIIGWDRKLRFILFNDIIPRTNFAKIISYSLEKSEKRVKDTKDILYFLKLCKA